MIVFIEDALRGAFEIVELTAAQRPEESGQSQEAENHGQGNQKQKAVHHFLPRARRIALPMTRIEEDDIAIAAISGVTSPAIANGTARRL